MVKSIIAVFLCFYFSIAAGFATATLFASSTPELISPIITQDETASPHFKANSTEISRGASVSLTPASHANPVANNIQLTIHMGSLSIDRNNLTVEEINSAVSAVATHLPNVDYIAIGTYLDYPEQIRIWSDAVHAHDFKLYLRSAGFNSWQGTNNSPTNQSPIKHIEDVVGFIHTNHSIFKSGDIFEAFPDEPANGNYWQKYPKGVATDKYSLYEFNLFLRQSIFAARQSFNKYDLEGVSVEVFHDNPSTAKDALAPETINTLATIGTDNYPEHGQKTPSEMANAMQTEINTWVAENHGNYPWEITFGPSIYHQLDQETQKSALQKELDVITATLPNLHGITIWQFGDFSNWPPSRIFDYIDGSWQPRSAVDVLFNI